jgi:hypothetical protein
MLLSKERILYLLNAYSEGTITEREELELFDWLKETGNQDLVLQHIEKLVHQPPAGYEAENVDWDKLYRQIIARTGLDLEPPLVRKWPLWYWAAAVALLVVLGIGVTKWLNQPAVKAVAHIEAGPLKADVAAPTKSKAVLTLADGTIIDLDSIGNGTLAHQGNVQVVKKPGGQIAYQGTGSEALFNVLNVPRGSKVGNDPIVRRNPGLAEQREFIAVPGILRGFRKKSVHHGRSIFRGGAPGRAIRRYQGRDGDQGIGHSLQHEYL